MEVSLIAHIEAGAGRADELAARLAAHAHDVRAEPGNRLFQVYRRRDATNWFDIVETYADEAAFAAHIAAPHSVRFNDWLRSVAVGGASQLDFVVAQ